MMHDDCRSLKRQKRDRKGLTVVIKDWHEELISKMQHRFMVLDIAPSGTPSSSIEPDRLEPDAPSPGGQSMHCRLSVPLVNTIL